MANAKKTYYVLTNEDGAIMGIILENAYIEQGARKCIQAHYNADIVTYYMTQPNMDYEITITVEIKLDEEDTEETETHTITATPATLFII